MVTNDILNRKGARKLQDIPKDVLLLLNTGEIETVNLTEWLAIDQMTLIDATFDDLGMGGCVAEVKKEVGLLKKPSTMRVIKRIGEVVYRFGKNEGRLDTMIDDLSHHQSDTIRCYATYLIALDDSLSLREKFDKSLVLAADRHFGVREIVWMALRPDVDMHLAASIEILVKWAKNEDENIRRFASEITRPRGVWCKHIESLKDNPKQAVEILEVLRNDPSPYVQNSVGNWLNDASKTQPQFVKDLCARWEIDSPTKPTAKIIKRALRTIGKS